MMRNMDDTQTQLQNYIQQQLQSGQTPDEIDAALRAAGWTEELIHAAFTAVQARMMPTSLAAAPPQAAAAPQDTVAPQANGRRRGRIRTGWQLFKQSWAILRGNKYLLRYLFMTGAWIFGITIVFVAIYWIFDDTLYQNDYSNDFKPLGYVLSFFDYLLVYFFINVYAAGLTANVLDIFQGNRREYQYYMRIAWSKAPALLVYSAIEAIVGMFLRYVVERIRWVGWLIAWLLGTAWSLGTLFVVPIIVTSEKPSGITSIKDSLRFFKQTWGQSITTKVSVNVPLFFMNLLLILAFIASVVGAVSLHSFPLLMLVVVMYLVLTVALAIVGSFANSLVNIALFYFAAYHKVPPAFSAELLNQVFIKRKRRFFKKAADPQAAA